jgi:SAM-dependent methyltransferase
MYLSGRCLVCGASARFLYSDPAFYRESLICEHCGTTSRYRSIARGLLRALELLRGIRANSLARLPARASVHPVHIFDTQPPFRYGTCAYPLPDVLNRCSWIRVDCSSFKPELERGSALGEGITNQDLQHLTFEDESIDVVVTSDVMEHVRLDDLAHAEIARVLRPGGVYLFTVPHGRDMEQSLQRVRVHDPADPARDEHVLEPEYHGDVNSEGPGALSYRVYGRDLDRRLADLGFEVDYEKVDHRKLGVVNTELFFCRKRPA